MIEYKNNIFLPKEQKTLLLRIVDIARKGNVLSVQYGIHKPNDPPYYLYFYVDSEKQFEIELPENPIPGLELLGFIKIIDDNAFFLLPEVFKWAEYERKNLFLKWLARLPNSIKDIMLGIAFTLSLILTALQIYDLLITFTDK